jgi:hypothetical protein
MLRWEGISGISVTSWFIVPRVQQLQRFIDALLSSKMLSDSGKDNQLHCFIPEEGIDVVALATSLRHGLDDIFESWQQKRRGVLHIFLTEGWD